MAKPATIETKAIVAINQKASDMVETARSLSVVDETSMEGATALLVFVAGAKKSLEEQRVFLVKPLNDHVKAINAKFKEWIFPLDEADRLVRRKALGYQQEQETIRLEALRQAEEARVATLGEPDVEDQEEETLPDLVERPSRTVTSDRGSTSVRKTWAFEVTDEDAVPREYLVIDDDVIVIAIRNGMRTIPGVRIYQKESLSVRAR